ncbi:MAG: cytochrome o ubiquinol oxidase subunit IV [Commensalibacter sp.]
MDNHNTVAPTGGGHGTVTSYIVGFILSVVLTVAAFYIVMNHSLSPEATGGVLGILAVIQIFVQVVFFLHVSAAPEKRWDLITLLSAAFVVIVICFGTLFVMSNASYHMMSR